MNRKLAQARQERVKVARTRMVELTEKFLMEAGGWEAMKEARALYEAGRVLEAAYDPPALAGLVRGGEGNFRAGLRVHSRTDMENVCTCAVSRRRGLICAHSLAVGVAVIRGLKSAGPLPGAPVSMASTAVAAAGDPNFAPDADGPEAVLHVILPPNFAAAWEKRSVMVVCEIETAGQRRPLGSLDATKRFRASEADVRLVTQLRKFADGKLPAMVMLTRAQFADLLGALAGNPRVTFGKTQPARIEGEGNHDTLRIERIEDGGLRVAHMSAGGTILLSGNAAWRLDQATFNPVAPGLPAAYFTIFDRPISIPADAAEAFVGRELPTLANFFEIEGDVAPVLARGGLMDSRGDQLLACAALASDEHVAVGRSAQLDLSDGAHDRGVVADDLAGAGADDRHTGARAGSVHDVSFVRTGAPCPQGPSSDSVKPR